MLFRLLDSTSIYKLDIMHVGINIYLSIYIVHNLTIYLHIHIYIHCFKEEGAQ